jgi:hypothetical protein
MGQGPAINHHERSHRERQDAEYSIRNRIGTQGAHQHHQDLRTGPEEATQVLQIAARQYPGLAMYAGVKFTAKTKDDWMHVQGATGSNTPSRRPASRGWHRTRTR